MQSILTEFNNYLQSLIDNIPNPQNGGTISDLRNKLTDYRNATTAFLKNAENKMNELFGDISDETLKTKLHSEIQKNVIEYHKLLTEKFFK